MNLSIKEANLISKPWIFIDFFSYFRKTEIWYRKSCTLCPQLWCVSRWSVSQQV